MSSQREVRPRNEAAHSYLHVAPEECFPAPKLLDAVRAPHPKRLEATDNLGQRTLKPEHVDFRFGDSNSHPCQPHVKRATDMAVH
jgi:hypothetical protein